jgi:dTDP-4-dehydrorhamnose 3,5-epimerase
MHAQQTELPGVMLLTPRRFVDARGYFAELYNQRAMAGIGVDLVFLQENHSLSEAVGTVRGLHFQSPPHAQAKLVRCGQGALWDVAVDVRRGSPTFGAWVGHELSAENGVQMLVPSGFLHGFVTLLPRTEIVYRCSDFYAPDCDGAVRWDDPDIAIDWPMDGRAPLLSDKDKAAQLMADFDSPFVYDGTA